MPYKPLYFQSYLINVLCFVLTSHIVRVYNQPEKYMQFDVNSTPSHDQPM